MKKQTLCLALVLAMMAAPLAAVDYGIDDRSAASIAGLWAWVLGFFEHGPVIISSEPPIESTGAETHGRHGSEAIPDGSPVMIPDDLPDGSTRHGVAIIVDG